MMLLNNRIGRYIWLYLKSNCDSSGFIIRAEIFLDCEIKLYSNSRKCNAKSYAPIKVGIAIKKPPREFEKCV